MKVLFAVTSIGLGHATRDLPLIRALLREGYELFIVSSGNALKLLQKEVPDCRFFDIPDYPDVFTSKKMSVSRLLAKGPLILKHVELEHKLAVSLQKRFRIDRIITDCRYGFYSKKVPSYWITNQLRFIWPLRFTPAELAIQFMHSLVQKRFVKVLVPDYDTDPISGDLNHNLRFLNKDNISYLGILSSVEKKNIKEDIDYFVSLSAGNSCASYFEELVLKDVHSLRGKVVVTKGNPHLTGEIIEKGNVTIYGYLDREAQALMMNRSKNIICRPGYTTLMELAELNKKAFFVPIPGQTEQNYLARFHKELGNFNFVNQSDLNLSEVHDLMNGFSGIQRVCKTKDSVGKFLSVF